MQPEKAALTVPVCRPAPARRTGDDRQILEPHSDSCQSLQDHLHGVKYLSKK